MPTILEVFGEVVAVSSIMGTESAVATLAVNALVVGFAAFVGVFMNVFAFRWHSTAARWLFGIGLGIVIR